MNDQLPNLLVGRRTELDLLERTSEPITSDGAAIVVVSGEAGIGKTRLVREHRRSQQRAGISVFHGGCVQLLDEPIPYAPISEALRRVRHQLRIRPIPGHAELQAALDRLLKPENYPRWLERAELFEELLAFIGLFAESSEAPPRITLVLEDLHWADKATLDLVVFLGRNLGTGSTLILTCRSELAPKPLASSLDALAHGEAPVIKIALRPMSRDEIAFLSQLVANQHLSELSVEQIYEASNGNPLLAAELATTLDLGQTPQAVNQILLTRTRMLSDDAISLLRLAAVIGDQVDHQVLSTASHLGDHALTDVLQECISSGLLEQDPYRTHYTFRHTQIQKAVLDTIPPHDRYQLHERVALALGGEPGANASVERATRSAYHWFAAKRNDRALVASIEAGRSCAELFAFEQAWLNFARALDIDQRRTLLPRGEWLAVAMEAAEAARWAGDLAKAIEVVQSAFNLVTSPHDIARLSERLGRFLWEAGRIEEAKFAYDDAYDALNDSPIDEVSARVAASRAYMSLLLGEHQLALQQAEDAIASAKAAAAQLEEARATMVKGMCIAFLGTPKTALGIFRRGHRTIYRLGDIDERRRATSNFAFILAMAGRTSAACDVAMVGFAELVRFGLEAKAGAALACNTITLLRFCGRWNEAEKISDQILESGLPDKELRYVRLARAGLDVLCGRFTDAEDHLNRARNGPDIPELLQVDLLLVEALLANMRTEYEHAETAVESAMSRLRDGEHDRTIAEACRLGLQVEAEIALSQHAREDASSRIEERLTAFRTRLERMSSDKSSAEIAAHTTTGLCEYSRAARADAVSSWTSASAAWEELEQPYEVAYCYLRRGEAELRVGLRADARRSLERSYRISRELQATPLRNAIESVAHRSRIVLEPGANVRQTGKAPLPQGVTGREHEVLVCLAEGLSDQQIADRLFISRRTVGVHVSHLLAKLNASRRGEAVAAALLSGLVEEGV